MCIRDRPEGVERVQRWRLRGSSCLWLAAGILGGCYLAGRQAEVQNDAVNHCTVYIAEAIEEEAKEANQRARES